MRIVRVLVVVALILSVGFNVIALTKLRSKRSVITVNGTGISKKDIDDTLMQESGPTIKAVMVERMLVEQEAKKKNVWPTDAEVDEAFEEQRELNWQFARQVESQPWKVGQAKASIRHAMAQARLRTADVPVSEEEITDEYNAHPQAYDKPNKAHVNLAVIMNENVATDVKQLMEKKDPPVSPSLIRQQFPGAVEFLGLDKRYTFVQPFGTEGKEKMIFDMKKDEVKAMGPGDLQSSGAKAVIIRMLDQEKGAKADLKDPKMKEKIRLQVALRRAQPWQEVLSKIWADTKFESEEQNDKKFIEAIFFPERAKAEANSK